MLAARLSEIGWSHLTGFLFLDQDGNQVDIMRAPIQELKQRTKRAWHHFVGASMAYRNGFAGLGKVDVALSTKPVPSWAADEAGLTRALHDGTFMTHHHLRSAKQIGSDSCKFCGKPDFLTHRHWECSYTEQLRQNLPAELTGAISTWPVCTRERRLVC